MNEVIVKKLNELLIEISNWDEIKEIKKLDILINDKYQDIIKAFNIEKNKFSEVFEYGQYHPDYKDAVKSFGIAKENLYNKEEVRRYFILVEETRIKLQNIIDEIATTISPTGFSGGGNVCVSI